MKPTVAPAVPEVVQPIVLQNAHCNNRIVESALAKMDHYTGFKVKADMYAFNKFKAAFERRSLAVRKDFTKLVNSHAVLEPATEKDKKTGKVRPIRDPKSGRAVMRPKMAPNPQTGQLDWVMKDEAAFQKDLKSLMSEPFEINARRWKPEDATGAGLTPQELRACSRMILDSDEHQDDAIIADDEDETDIDPALLGDPIPEDEPTAPEAPPTENPQA